MRKPDNWAQVPFAKVIGPKQEIALQRIAREGIFELAEGVRPFDEAFPHYTKAGRLEFIITRPPVMLFLSKSEREFYYVNCEGRQYAYNVLRLPFSLISQIIPGLPGD